jgi:hypothetical protein
MFESVLKGVLEKRGVAFNKNATAKPLLDECVKAGALGFHHTTTTRQHVNAGATWSHYVAGSRPSPQGQR